MTRSTISVWILGDQLLARHPALAAAEEAFGRSYVRVVLVESAARAACLPCQRKKLIPLFSAMRHHAEELRRQGWHIDHIQADTVLFLSEGRPAAVQVVAQYVSMVASTSR